jgi:hypothetical protein
MWNSWTFVVLTGGLQGKPNSSHLFNNPLKTVINGYSGAGGLLAPQQDNQMRCTLL